MGTQKNIWVNQRGKDSVENYRASSTRINMLTNGTIVKSNSKCDGFKMTKQLRHMARLSKSTQHYINLVALGRYLNDLL